MGKSTTAKLLKAHAVVAAACEVDDFRHMLGALDWHDRSQHDIALEAAANAALVFANRLAAPSVLVDCFGRNSAARIAAHLEVEGASTKIISLWASPTELRRRIAHRVEGYQDVEMALLINQEVGDSTSGDALVDTTSLEAEGVVEVVAHALRGER